MALKPAQLASIKRLLRNAHNLVEDAAVMFRKSGDEETARRLKSVADFIADEIRAPAVWAPAARLVEYGSPSNQQKIIYFARGQMRRSPDHSRRA